MMQGMAKVLVVGGAGYVGSTTAIALRDLGHSVTVLDNLSTGHPELLGDSQFIHGDIGDADLLRALFSEEKFDVALHFAAKTIVPESVAFPDLYYDNNVRKTKILIDELLKAGVSRFVFSSTCAIFGEVDQLVHENLPFHPLSPYGQNKLDVEKYLDSSKQAGLKSIALRYFNASGAEEKLRTGEWHSPETHLIPRVVQAALDHKPITVFGKDYPTLDGTCIRDYVHVSDLAQAHISAVNQLMKMNGAAGSFDVFNLGTGHGHSVLEVIDQVQSQIGRPIDVIHQPRRDGDAVRLVADLSKASRVLGFSPHRKLKEVVHSAIGWETKRRTLEHRKILVLDRDGTVNFDPGYISRTEDFTLIDGVAEAVALAKSKGWVVAIATNQSGVGRGKIAREELFKVHIKLQRLLAEKGGRIDYFAVCMHAPMEECACRKPKVGLLDQISRDLKVKPKDMVMIGDRDADIGLGRNFGVRSVGLVLTGDGQKTLAESQLKSDWVAADLLEACRRLPE